MARIERTITVPRSIEEAFDYVAAFENIARWDPATIWSEKLSDGPPRVGSSYQLVIKIGRGTTPMRYEITELDRPLRVVLLGEGEKVTSEDDVRFALADGQTRITYRLDVRLKGPFRPVAELVARPALNRLADAGIEGLQRALSR